MNLAAKLSSFRSLIKRTIPTLATMLELLCNLSLTPVESGTSYPNAASESGKIKPSIVLACIMPCLLKYFVPTSGGCCVPFTFTSLMVLSAANYCSHRYLTTTCRALPKPTGLPIDMADEASSSN
eukprot:4326457-Amphidinium_carterae.2